MKKVRVIEVTERVMPNKDVCLMNGLKTIAIEHINGRVSVHDRLDTFEKRVVEKRRGILISLDANAQVVNLND